jgi:hypothetical protein
MITSQDRKIQALVKFHPGPAGYRKWGMLLAGGMTERLS